MNKISKREIMKKIGEIDPAYIEKAAPDMAFEYLGAKNQKRKTLLRFFSLVAAVVLLIGTMIVTGVMLSKKDRTPEIPDIEEPENTEPKEPEKKQIETKTDYVVLPNVPRNTPIGQNDYNVEIDGSFFEKIEEEAKKREDILFANAPKTMTAVINGEKVVGELLVCSAGRLCYDGMREVDGLRVTMFADMDTNELCGYLIRKSADKTKPVISDNELLTKAREKAKEFIDIDEYNEEIVSSGDEFRVAYTYRINGIDTVKLICFGFNKYSGDFVGYDSQYFGDFNEDEMNSSGLSDIVKEMDFDRICKEVVDYMQGRVAVEGVCKEISDYQLVKVNTGTYALKFKISCYQNVKDSRTDNEFKIFGYAENAYYLLG